MLNRLFKPSRDIGKQEEGAPLEGRGSVDQAGELVPLPPSEKSREPSHEGALHRQRPPLIPPSIPLDAHFRYRIEMDNEPLQNLWHDADHAPGVAGIEDLGVGETLIRYLVDPARNRKVGWLEVRRTR